MTITLKKKPPDKPLDTYKAIKVPLKHILKNYDINQPKINDLVVMAHKIVIHTLQFIKLYSSFGFGYLFESTIYELRNPLYFAYSIFFLVSSK